MLDWLLKRTQAPLAGGLDTEFPLLSAGQGGLLAGTHVASNLGWRPVEALTPGDQVLTFDHGMQTITGLGRETLLVCEGDLAPAHCPVLIPRDALNNRAAMWVMPDQGVLLESELVEDAQGDPFAVVPACALQGYRGIRRAHPGARLELVVPQFARGEVIYCEAGLLAYAPPAGDLLQGGGLEDLYRVLPPEEARDLVCALIAEDGLWAADLPFVPGTSGYAAAPM